MRIFECWFCGRPIYPGHGITFVRNDAKVLRFCKSKCRKAYSHRRNPRNVRWTKAYRRTHGKEMTVDATLEFIKKRNRPLKYNRNRIQLVLQSIKRIHAVRERRERMFYENRMKGKASRELELARRELEENAHMLQGPSVMHVDALSTAPSNEVDKVKVPEPERMNVVYGKELRSNLKKARMIGRKALV